MDISNMKQAQKLTYYINTLLALFVGGLAIVFKILGITELFYVNLCAFLFYIVAYVMIYKEKVDTYLFSVYIVITVFMIVTTVFLGIKAGFQMYISSMIPLIYFCDYFADKLGTRRVKPLIISLLIAFAYIFSTAFAVIHGPVYELDWKIIAGFFGVNSLWVIFLLIMYSASMISLVRNSEEKLRKMAQMDKLTRLYNRHFMMSRLNEIYASGADNQWIAMLDIDDFKVINDTYGHNAGDAALVKVSDIMREVCGKCEYARWGGEEFLVTADSSISMEEILETLRRRVDEEMLTHGEQQIHFTITIGACICKENTSVENWIEEADQLLYQGKHKGKNCVVINK